MSIASRLNRLHRDIGEAPCPVCDGTPRIHRISAIYEGDPSPSFPGPDAPEHCECGRRVKYQHNANVFELCGGGVRTALRPDFIDGPVRLVRRIVGVDAMKTAHISGISARVTVGASTTAEP